MDVPPASLPMTMIQFFEFPFSKSSRNIFLFSASSRSSSLRAVVVFVVVAIELGEGMVALKWGGRS